MNETSIYDVIVVGAGASGLLCALECARRGKKTLILEKASQPGRKILISGNGRCNLTNRYVNPDAYHGNKELLTSVLSQFSYAACKAYFEQLGVLLTEESQGRIFPFSGKSTAVLEPLKIALQEAGAQLLLGQEVVRIQTKTHFRILTKSGETFLGRRVVLACGSCAYPQAGGSTLGYELAKQLGHSIVTPQPSLSALCLKEKSLARLTGIRSQVLLQVWDQQQIADQSEGEILFTNYGLNGPAALNVSGTITRLLKNGNVNISLNFFPQLKDFSAFLSQRIEIFSNRRPKDFLAGLLHENIANLLIDFVGIRKNISLKEQTPNTLHKLTQTLIKWPLTVTSLRPWNESMVAAGGVKTCEINYNTFESKFCKRLYITGELLDVEGKSGGFNLHFAWASGMIAAKHLTTEE